MTLFFVKRSKLVIKISGLDFQWLKQDGRHYGSHLVLAIQKPNK
jgi:hypothetical protein